MATAQRLTYNDLLALPDDGYQHELVRGEILRMPPPKGQHGRLEMVLGEEIGLYLRDRALAQGWQAVHGRVARDRLVGCLMGGEAGIRFSLPDDPNQVRGADLLYLSPEQVARCESIYAQDYIPEVPVLVAEVVSITDKAVDVEQKVNDYLAGGARVVWLFYPNRRTVKVCHPDGVSYTVPPDGVLDGGEILPGFSIPLANLFL